MATIAAINTEQHGDANN